MPLLYIIGDWTLDGKPPGSTPGQDNSSIQAAMLVDLMDKKSGDFKVFNKKQDAINYSAALGKCVHAVFIPPAFYELLVKEKKMEGAFSYEHMSLPEKLSSVAQLEAARLEFLSIHIARRGGSSAIIDEYFADLKQYYLSEATSLPGIGAALKVTALFFYDKQRTYGEIDTQAMRTKQGSLPERDIRSNTMAYEVKLVNKFYNGNDSERHQAVREYFVNQADAGLRPFDAEQHFNYVQNRLTELASRSVDSKRLKKPIDVLIPDAQEQERMYAALKKEINDYCMLERLSADLQKVLENYKKLHPLSSAAKVEAFIKTFEREKYLLLRTDLSREQILVQLIQKIEIKFAEVSKSKSIAFFNDAPKDHHFTRLLGLMLNGIYNRPEMKDVLTSENSLKIKNELAMLKPAESYTTEVHEWSGRKP